MKRKTRGTKPAKAVPVRKHADAPIRFRRIQRLCIAFDCDPVAGELIVELLERVETLQRELDRLHL